MKLSITLSKAEFDRILIEAVSNDSNAEITDFYVWSEGHATFDLLSGEHRPPPAPVEPPPTDSAPAVEDQIPY